MNPDSIVITGLGLVLPCGDGVAVAREAWAVQSPAFTDLPPSLGEGRAAACLAFNPKGIIPPLQLRRLDRPSRFAWVAAHQAFQDSGLDLQQESSDPGLEIGLAVGTTTGSGEASEAFIRLYLEKGPEGASPMIFPNSVANAAAGHVALAFGLKGPSTTQFEREAGTLVALEQAVRWLNTGMARAVMVIGTDGLFPLQVELLHRLGLSRRQGEPLVGRGGYLPGEGAQAFLLERRGMAEARGARIRAVIGAVASASPRTTGLTARTEALSHAVTAVEPEAPARWIAGSSGHTLIDRMESRLHASHMYLPKPHFPKLLWGECCGAGGQLLAAALLEPATSVLITAPASSGSQWACRLDDIQTDFDN